jgi:hypothetical protein
MAFCSGIDEECRIFINHPCVSPTLQILSKTYIDEAGNAITENSANGVITTITTTPIGTTTVVQSVDTESTTTTLPNIKKTQMTFAGEGKEFDTDDYHNANETEELFVDIRELMGILGAEVAIIAFIAICTELVSAWLDDKNALPNGLGVRAYIQAGNYGGEDPSNRATYRPNRDVAISRQINTIDSVRTVVLYFRFIRGDKGKPGECRRS